MDMKEGWEYGQWWDRDVIANHTRRHRSAQSCVRPAQVSVSTDLRPHRHTTVSCKDWRKPAEGNG